MHGETVKCIISYHIIPQSGCGFGAITHKPTGMVSTVTQIQLHNQNKNTNTTSK